jgi:hypothetical protein
LDQTFARLDRRHAFASAVVWPVRHNGRQPGRTARPIRNDAGKITFSMANDCMNANTPPVSALFAILLAMVLVVAVTNAPQGHKRPGVDAVQICSLSSQSNCSLFRLRS